ncbi:S-norcoclaurine synthase 1 [Manihot esculenta]|uniref:S-norcoclaurine synthase 1 n=1 Tax=Manihot esculenta TaxID=3983 RepID=UPI001CC33F49|nr:S-norcoclaurine synthase 1 [Manihot esculenta]
MGQEDGWTKGMGGSLPVENVQALASKNLKDIPHRYIRPDLEFDDVSVDEALQIPVIDMSKLVGNHSDHGDELAELHQACENWGFFQLINHGVPEEAMENMKRETEEFFKLPLEEKMACAQLPDSIEGYGQAFVVSEEQKLDWGDMLFLLSMPNSIRKMRYCQLFPLLLGKSFSESEICLPMEFTDLLSSIRLIMVSFYYYYYFETGMVLLLMYHVGNLIFIREIFYKYSTEVQRVAECLVRLMGRNLEIEPKKLGSMFEDGIQSIRLNYYPPCVEANKVTGLNTHSDSTGLTLLIQANEVQGLQIKKNGKWVPIKPIPGAFIVNIGDIMEIMSNGKYKSIEHRAVVNPEKERLSIAAFHGPNMKSIIAPLEDLVKKETPNYKSLTHEEFVKLVVRSKIDGKSIVGRMKLEH